MSKDVKRMSLEQAESFTSDQVTSAIKSYGKNRAYGPDSLSIFHLKNLGPLVTERLTALYYDYLKSCRLPSIWKNSLVIPIPKLGKDSSHTDAYRWFRGIKSSTRIVRTGVPQGSKWSPSLFNDYITDMPRPTPQVKRVCYADDITVWASGPKIPQSMINSYLREGGIYLKENSLLISASKSTVTLFTPDTHQFQTQPNITLDTGSHYGSIIILPQTLQLCDR